MTWEYIYTYNGKIKLSDGALFPCLHCKKSCGAICWYWVGYWPHCTQGHDQRICPFDFLNEFEEWFQWHATKYGLHKQQQPQVIGTQS